MRFLLGWMRTVLPHDAIVATAIAADLVVETFYVVSLVVWGAADEVAFATHRLAIQVLAAIVYGGHRVVTFHPACDAEYRRWLDCTPWTPRHRLPMGPVHLVAQDLAVIAISMLLTRIDDVRVLYVPTAFLSAYCLSLASVSWKTGQKLLAYALCALLGLVILFIQNPSAALSAAMTTTALTPVVIRQSLKDFPWQLPWFADGRPWQQIIDDSKQNQWGWPFDVFAPKVPRPWIETIDGIGVSGIVGWWFAAIYVHAPRQARMLLFFWLQFLTIAVIVRLSIYFKHHRAPISFGGRMATGRWWQLRFDYVLIAPGSVLLVAMVSLAGTLAAGERIPMWALGGAVMPAWLELPMAVGCVSLSLLILLLGGPALERWRLTGCHRIVFQQNGKATGLGSSEKNQEFVQTA